MALEKQVWDVMSTEFESVTPETTLKEACAILVSLREKQPVTGLVVRRASGEYLGVLAVKDILRHLNFVYDQSLRENASWLDHLLNKRVAEGLLSVNDVMTRFDVSVRPNQKVIDAIRVMLDEDVDLLPVGDAGRIIGVVYGDSILREISRCLPGA
ncbi:MAG: CBS domain-containing protein [Deltaproteobacteria bacterium]|nr:CBS domain-containing protein [Deltaproteobacteria bacterium]